MFKLIRTLHTGYQYAPVEYDTFEEALHRARNLNRVAWIKWVIHRRSDGVILAQSK